LTLKVIHGDSDELRYTAPILRAREAGRQVTPTDHDVDPVDGDGRTGLNRRQMIKAAGIAGAAAWTAPMIIDSLSSPAAAATATPGCYQIHYSVISNSCSATPTVASVGCTLTGTTCGTPAVSIPANTLACLSQTSPTPCGTSSTDAANAITFTVGAGCSCKIVAAAGRRTSGIGAECSVSATITSANKVVVFDGTGFQPQFAEWDSFEIWLSCG